jgi:hypothetical protein
VAKPARDGDIDGDGKIDRIALAGLGQLEVTYSAGGRDRVPFGSDDPGQKVLGAVDADSDGYAEVFVQAYAGAAARGDLAFRFVEGKLRLMTVDGEPAQLNRVGSLRNQGTWACRTSDGPIVQWTSSTEDGKTYAGDVRSYRFTGSRMVLTSQEQYKNEPEPRGPGASSGCGSLNLDLN